MSLKKLKIKKTTLDKYYKSSPATVSVAGLYFLLYQREQTCHASLMTSQ